MAQKPAKRHVLANARIEIGLSQGDLADLLGYSTATVQRIEQGTLALSEELALKVQEALDISATWLLANDPARPPITPGGGLWNKFNYEFTQASQPEFEPVDISLRDELERENEVKTSELSEDLAAREIYAMYRAMLKKARGSPKRTILMYRVQKAFQELKKDFPPDEESFEELSRLGIEKAYAEYKPHATGGLMNIARRKPSKPKK
jgi:transcriptional regulator with XRE-family HTH domain